MIHQSDQVLNAMGDWCQKHHAKSGLTESVRQSKISLKECEETVHEFLVKHTKKGACPLAGNSVGQDAKFLEKYMPKITQHLHYRIIDVSTIKELTKRWYPEIAREAPKKRLSHRALDDIKESIEELKFYREKVFK